MIFPKHEGGMSIFHNEHRTYYQSIVRYEESREAYGDWISTEERERAIETDSLWEIQWFPVTPAGFRLGWASSLETLLDWACAQ